jgi:hypothetical protein
LRDPRKLPKRRQSRIDTQASDVAPSIRNWKKCDTTELRIIE